MSYRADNTAWNGVTAWERVKALAEVSPRGAVILANTLAPVAAPAMIARLESDAAYR